MSAATKARFSPTDIERFAIGVLRRRLARWELQHLRTLAAELHAKLEEAESRAAEAEDQARFWWDHSVRLEADWRAENPSGVIGLTKEGGLVVLRDGVPA